MEMNLVLGMVFLLVAISDVVIARVVLPKAYAKKPERNEKAEKTIENVLMAGAGLFLAAGVYFLFS